MEDNQNTMHKPWNHWKQTTSPLSIETAMLMCYVHLSELYISTEQLHSCKKSTQRDIQTDELWTGYCWPFIDSEENFLVLRDEWIHFIKTQYTDTNECTRGIFEYSLWISKLNQSHVSQFHRWIKVYVKMIEYQSNKTCQVSTSRPYRNTNVNVLCSHMWHISKHWTIVLMQKKNLKNNKNGKYYKPMNLLWCPFEDRVENFLVLQVDWFHLIKNQYTDTNDKGIVPLSHKLFWKACGSH